MPTRYANPQSRGRIARWMLKEAGQPLDRVVLDHGTAMKAPTFPDAGLMASDTALIQEMTS